MIYYAGRAAFKGAQDKPTVHDEDPGPRAITLPPAERLLDMTAPMRERYAALVMHEAAWGARLDPLLVRAALWILRAKFGEVTTGRLERRGTLFTPPIKSLKKRIGLWLAGS